jgi:hypothetical protein
MEKWNQDVDPDRFRATTGMKFRFVERLGDTYLDSPEYYVPIPGGMHLTGRGCWRLSQVLASPVGAKRR